MNEAQGSVLVVEDDRQINALVGAYAGICGFTYRPAMDGQSALAEARRDPPDAVILDLMLPDLDGFEVCRLMRNEPALHDVPIIILSALSSAKDRQRGREAGADDYLTKPFDPDELIKTLTNRANRVPTL